MSKDTEIFRDYTIQLSNIDKDPFFDTFDVFNTLNLRGKTLLQAMNIVIQKADELYTNYKTTVNIAKIPGYRYHEGQFSPALLNEEKIINNINKSKTMLEYDHLVLNLVALADFYKVAYHKSKIYEPYFNYIHKIFEKFKEIQELIENYEVKKFEIDRLIAENQFVMKSKSELEVKYQDLQKQMKKFDSQFRNMFMNERILKFFMGAIDRKIIKTQAGYNVFQSVSRILWEGRMAKKDLAKSMGMTIKELDELVEPYKELFSFEDKFIDLNFDYSDIKRQKIMLDYNEILQKHGLKDIPDLEEEIDIEKKESEPKEEQKMGKEMEDAEADKNNILDLEEEDEPSEEEIAELEADSDEEFNDDEDTDNSKEDEESS